MPVQNPSTKLMQTGGRKYQCRGHDLTSSIILTSTMQSPVREGDDKTAPSGAVGQTGIQDSVDCYN